MKEKKIKENTGNKFYLNKWYLDFVGEQGDAMIFYAAEIKWHGWSATYTSWLHYNKGNGVKLRSRFFKVQMPQVQDNIITWADAGFGVSGTWESSANMIRATLFDSDEGNLLWNCFQPASKVQLRMKDSVLKGSGYAEQLILTVPPWRIPMNELRWGRFGSDNNNLVWIELRGDEKRQWLWLNNERIENCLIEDGQISIPGKGMILNLDRTIVLESEKKIFSVVRKLIRYIPGFNKIMPLNFLNADESKWLSKGQLQHNKKTIATGSAIHELVNFNVFDP